MFKLHNCRDKNLVETYAKVERSEEEEDEGKHFTREEKYNRKSLKSLIRRRISDNKDVKSNYVHGKEISSNLTDHSLSSLQSETRAQIQFSKKQMA